jgi:hypothetical protein
MYPLQIFINSPYNCNSHPLKAVVRYWVLSIHTMIPLMPMLILTTLLNEEAKIELWLDALSK